jgi:hypothetical protein
MLLVLIPAGWRDYSFGVLHHGKDSGRKQVQVLDYDLLTSPPIRDKIVAMSDSQHVYAAQSVSTEGKSVFCGSYGAKMAKMTIAGL